jgi:hypothetical protein
VSEEYQSHEPGYPAPAGKWSPAYSDEAGPWSQDGAVSDGPALLAA